MADQSQPEPTFAEAFQAALGKAGFAKVKPGELPSGKDLLAALGGIRGLAESILPGLAFLVAYSVSNVVLHSPDYLLWSVGVPLVLCLVFVVARLVARQPLRAALSGVIVAAVTAGLALFTGHAKDAFVPGIITNVVCVVVLLVSLAVRWPLIGIFAGALTADLTGWRADPAKRRVLTIATWLWVGLFALRLAVEVPLYLNNLTDWLAGAKLFLGVPLYAVLLWITWLFVGTVFATGEPTIDSTGDPADAQAGDEESRDA